MIVCAVCAFDGVKRQMKSKKSQGVMPIYCRIIMVIF